jgi:hypothetical protein
LPELVDTLRLIDQAALSVILDPKSTERRAALRALIVEHLPALAEQRQSETVEILLRRITGVSREIVRAFDSTRFATETARQGLILSYVRTLRGFIGAVLRLLE